MSIKKLLALLLAAAMVFGIAACSKTTTTTGGGSSNVPTASGGDTDSPYVWVDDGKNYTYHTYTTITPSNWNELTYQDENDSTLIGYTTSSFFIFDYKFETNKFGETEIVSGDYTVKYSAASKLEDVTAQYAKEWGLGDVTSGYAYKITLRDDLKWQNGDPIVAEDFVYSMQEQLNPLFQNYRADSYYAGSVNLVGAKAYAKQGQSGWFAAHSAYDTYSTDLDSKLIFTLAAPTDDQPAESYIRKNWIGFPATYDAAAAADYLVSNYWGDLEGVTTEVLAKMEGKTLAEIKADTEMNTAWKSMIGWWQSEPNEELHFFVTNYTYPEASWDDVGLLAVGKYELVVIMTEPLTLLDDDGNLTYHCAYDFSGLPLVHKETYEKCKVAPTGDSTLWTTTYNQSAKNTMSWGPYKLESFQAGKQYVVTRNTEWYGYNMKENEGLYQTDRIVCDKVDEWSTAWNMFRAGQVDGISIDVSIAEEYKGSSRAYFTPDDFITSAQLQSNYEALKSRQEDGVNKTILTYSDFRKAMSLAINRADYAEKCTTSSMAGFGIFNSMHYYDVENGGVYRDTDEAKKVLCETYGVDISKYASLDAAVDSITGYNLTLAKELVTKAYNAALADGEIKETDKVVLVWGTSTDTESTRRSYNYLKTAWEEMCVGTPLEGRIEIEFDASFGTKWANDFRAGGYDICTGGWSGAAWNPGYFLLAYLDDNYRYAQGWDTSAVMMTYTMVGDSITAENGGGKELTMSLIEWYNCLNAVEGREHPEYDWSENAIDQEDRLQLIAALEAQVLQSYYCVPMLNYYAASMLSYKVDYITYEYNTFMVYGGLKYMTYNFTDEEWEAEVAKQNNELNYKI